jgi:hypothetical protein
MGLGYLMIMVSGVGSVVLLLAALERMGVGRTREGAGALWVYAITLACGVALTIRSEIRWRKSVALLEDKKLMSMREKKD